MNSQHSTPRHTCLRAEVVSTSKSNPQQTQIIFIKGVWFDTHFSLAITDGGDAWLCDASEEDVRERASQWDQPVSEYIEFAEKYLGFQQPGSVYRFTNSGYGHRRLSWTIEKEGINLEWQWRCKPSSNCKKTTSEILDYLMEANIGLSKEVVKTDQEFDKCLVQSERISKDKEALESAIYPKMIGDIMAAAFAQVGGAPPPPIASMIIHKEIYWVKCVMNLGVLTYSGQQDPAVLEHISKMTRVYKALQVPEDRRVSIASFFLKGAASTWWDMVEAEHMANPDFSWEAYLTLLRRTYYPEYLRQQTRLQFERLTQGDKSVNQYYSKFIKLYWLLRGEGYIDNNLAERFRRGLASRIQTTMGLEVYGSLEECCNAASRTEYFLQLGHETLGNECKSEDGGGSWENQHRGGWNKKRKQNHNNQSQYDQTNSKGQKEKAKAP